MRKFIIHLLGGITQSELAEQQASCHELGKFSAYLSIREHIRSRYGMDPSQHLAELWTILSDYIDHPSNEGNE